MFVDLIEVCRFRLDVIFSAKSSQAFVMQISMHVSLVYASRHDIKTEVEFTVVYKERIIYVTLN